MRTNLRWCSDGFEFTCWNGEIVRGAFVIDAHDREIIAWRAVTGGGISGSDVRDMMLEAVEARFGTARAPSPIEWLSDNGSPYTAKDTRRFAGQLNIAPVSRAGREPREQRDLRSLRQNAEARLCPRESAAGRRQGARPDRRMVRGLQRQPSSFWATDALATRVQTRPQTRRGVRSIRGQHLGPGATEPIAVGHTRRLPWKMRAFRKGDWRYLYHSAVRWIGAQAGHRGDSCDRRLQPSTLGSSGA